MPPLLAECNRSKQDGIRSKVRLRRTDCHIAWALVQQELMYRVVPQRSGLGVKTNLCHLRRFSPERISPEMHHLNRLSAVWRSGGLIAVVRLLYRRFVFKRWSSVVFSADSIDLAVALPLPLPHGYEYRWYRWRSDLSLAECSSLQQAGAGGFLSDLASDDALYVIWCGGEATSWGAVPRVTLQRAVLGLPGNAHLIGSCETQHSHRGRGLYRTALIRTVAALRAAGDQPIFIEVLEDNVVSMGAIEKAGFRRLGRIDAHIFLGCLVRRAGRWQWLRGHVPS